MDGLTMSALAKQLKVGVMTLYSYFRGRDELLDAMGRRAALELYDEHVDITTGTWQDELRAHYHAIRESLKRHPALADLVFHRGEVLPSSDPENYGPILAHVQRHVGAMTQGGVPPEIAIRGFFGLSMFTVASALRKDDYTRNSSQYRDYLDGLVRLLSGTSPDSDQGDTRFGADNEYDFMLDVFIDGIASAIMRDDAD
jgi:AcrR family transcriptional regulator